jgi:hypothetical protein
MRFSAAKKCEEIPKKKTVKKNATNMNHMQNPENRYYGDQQLGSDQFCDASYMR